MQRARHEPSKYFRGLCVDCGKVTGTRDRNYCLNCRQAHFGPAAQLQKDALRKAIHKRVRQITRRKKLAQLPALFCQHCGANIKRKSGKDVKFCSQTCAAYSWKLHNRAQYLKIEYNRNKRRRSTPQYERYNFEYSRRPEVKERRKLQQRTEEQREKNKERKRGRVGYTGRNLELDNHKILLQLTMALTEEDWNAAGKLDDHKEDSSG